LFGQSLLLVELPLDLDASRLHRGQVLLSLRDGGLMLLAGPLGALAGCFGGCREIGV
jgi:hypothetical protein